jgi:LemA protein
MGYLPIIVIVLVVVLAFWVISAYNGFIKLRNKVEEAFATMYVYLKKRYDLIPNLVETVKGYAKHESQTLENVIAARNMAAGAKTTEEKVAGENALQGTLKSLFAVVEAYPDLKANTQFINLQGQLTEMEGEIANSRKYYNAIVKTFNTKVEVFPSNIVAKLFKFTRKTMFEVEDAEQRQNVKVQF